MLVLKPSWLTICGTTLFAVVLTGIVSAWVLGAVRRGAGISWETAFPLAIAALAYIQGYRSLRVKKVFVTPTCLGVIAGPSETAVGWADVEAILLKLVPGGRGLTPGIAIICKARPTIALQDGYQTPREDVFQFLSDHAAIYAPHVKTGQSG